MKKILSIFPAVIFCFLLNNVHAQTNVQDSLALVDLYNSTNGASWTSSTNWLAGPVSTWQGITVSAGRVKEINLTANNLTGTLPVSIGNLSELDSLTLVGNFISGSVPSSLGNLSKLVWLDLTYNQFTGSIPSSLSTLANLDLLSLSSNNLSGSIPTEFGNFKKITELDLSFNSLTGSIPSSLGNVTTLNVLNLEFNLLSGSIPAQISQLSSLKKLLLDNNNLTGSLPAKMNNLSRLSSLNLSSNQLSGSIPEDVTNKVNINYFNLGNNNFTGSIPVSFGNCTNLVFLWLNNNSLSGSVPAELLNITTLQSLWLYSNKLNFNDENKVDAFASIIPASKFDTVAVIHAMEENLSTVNAKDELFKGLLDSLNVKATLEHKMAVANKFISNANTEQSRTQKVSTVIFWLLMIGIAIITVIKNYSLIPLMGVTTCLYLLTGMTKANWLWFGGWLVIGLVIYFLYGYKKSKLAV